MNLLTKAAESNEYTTGIYVVNHSTLPQKSYFYANYHTWLKEYFTNVQMAYFTNNLIHYSPSRRYKSLSFCARHIKDGIKRW